MQRYHLVDARQGKDVSTAASAQDQPNSSVSTSSLNGISVAAGPRLIANGPTATTMISSVSGSHGGSVSYGLSSSTGTGISANDGEPAVGGREFSYRTLRPEEGQPGQVWRISRIFRSHFFHADLAASPFEPSRQNLFCPPVCNRNCSTIFFSAPTKDMNRHSFRRRQTSWCFSFCFENVRTFPWRSPYFDSSRSDLLVASAGSPRFICSPSNIEI